MLKSSFRPYYLSFGLIALLTLIYDSFINIHDIANFYSAFTIQSLTFSIIVFLYIGLVKKEAIGKFNIDIFRGATVVFTLTSALVFGFLVANTVQIGIFWVDFVLHKLIPAAALLGWILYPPKKRVSFKTILAWLIFPVFYFIYSLLRGAVTGWYPYYFLNPTRIGYSGVFNFSLKLFVGGITLSLIIIAIGNLSRKVIKSSV